MRRADASWAMLVAALFAVALAVAGLAVGVVHVPRGFELAPFVVAVVMAVMAMWRALGRLLDGDDVEDGGGRLTRILSETQSEQRRLFERRRERLAQERAAARGTMRLLAVSLVAGAGVAVVRSGADVAGGESTPAAPGVVVSTSGDPLPIVGLAAAGIALALVAALLWGGGRRRAAAAGAAVAGTAALVSALGHLNVEPHFEVTPTLKIDRPTLIALQRAALHRAAPGTTGPLLAVRLGVTVRPPRLTVQLPEHRSLTLLSLGGLRVSLAPHQPRAPCDCGGDLAPTP